MELGMKRVSPHTGTTCHFQFKKKAVRIVNNLVWAYNTPPRPPHMPSPQRALNHVPPTLNPTYPKPRDPPKPTCALPRRGSGSVSHTPSR